MTLTVLSYGGGYMEMDINTKLDFLIHFMMDNLYIMEKYLVPTLRSENPISNIALRMQMIYWMPWDIALP